MKLSLGLRTVLSLVLTGAASTQLAACASDVDVPGMPAADGGAQQPADAGRPNPPPADAGQQIVCGDRLVLCGTTCVNLTQDGNNCGGCGRVCGAGTTCVNSDCAANQPADAGTQPPPSDSGVTPPPACGAGQMSCSGTCCTLATDVNNCGACGNRCASGEACMGGMCVGSAEDTYEVTATAPMPVNSIDINNYWAPGNHGVANYLDPERAGRPLTTYTFTFRVPRGQWVALNETYTYVGSDGRNVAIYGCSIHTVGGPNVVYGTRTVRRNGSMVVMTVTRTNNRAGCNFVAADRTPPPGY